MRHENESLIVRLSELIESAPRKPRCFQEAAWEEIYELKQALAREFGESRGWRLAKTNFWWPAIAPREMGYLYGCGHEYFDHLYC